MTEEIWKAAPGWEGLYEVSSLGRARSLTRVVAARYGSRRTVTGRVLKQNTVSGYPQVHLSNGSDDANVFVHALVCEAFHGARPAGHQACHNDGSKTNNCAYNLRWGTASDNALDAVRHGNWGHGPAKLTDQQVLEIRCSAERQTTLARQYGVSQALISQIKLGQARKSLKSAFERAAA